MIKKRNIEESIKAFDNGHYADPDVNVQKAAGWDVWSCKDETLLERTNELYDFLKRVVKQPFIDVKNQCVRFVNQNTLNGDNLDAIWILDRKTKKVLHVIFPSIKRLGFDTVEVWSYTEDTPLFFSCDLKDFVK